jgi:hypothetical protein
MTQLARFPFAFLLLRRWFGIMRDFAGHALATRLSHLGIKAFHNLELVARRRFSPVLPLFSTR